VTTLGAVILAGVGSIAVRVPAEIAAHVQLLELWLQEGESKLWACRQNRGRTAVGTWAPAIWW